MPNYAKFGIMPVEVMEIEGLCASAKFLYSVLYSFSGGKGECWPSSTTIQKRCKMSRSHMVELINVLEKAGIVERDKEKRNTTTYILKINIGDAKIGDEFSTSPVERTDELVRNSEQVVRPAEQGVQYTGHEVYKLKEKEVYKSKEKAGKKKTTNSNLFPRFEEGSEEDSFVQYVLNSEELECREIVPQPEKIEEWVVDWKKKGMPYLSFTLQAITWLEDNPKEKKKNFCSFYNNWLINELKHNPVPNGSNGSKPVETVEEPEVYRRDAPGQRAKEVLDCCQFSEVQIAGFVRDGLYSRKFADDVLQAKKERIS